MKLPWSNRAPFKSIHMIAFGPIPSRRFGQSLGINHIPPKSCSYDCIYCQVGHTLSKSIQRDLFYDPGTIFEAVRAKVEQVRESGGHIDYLTFVPDGEPTLDINLGRTIDMLRELDLKIAVISNASLLWHEAVRKELAKADCVSLKIDAVTTDRWRRINRPNKSLSLEKMLAGVLAFAEAFNGKLITDTMLVEGVNNTPSELRSTAQFLGKLHPSTAYIALPTRPPLEPWVKAPEEKNLIEAYQIFSEYVEKVEILAGFAPEPFSAAGDVAQNLLDILCVHPMRESEVYDLFERGGLDLSVLQQLVTEAKIARVLHAGQAFYVRKLEAPPA